MAVCPLRDGRREVVRLQAAQLFAQDASPVQVAHRLRVSTKSACQWRRRWRAGGQAALASAGPGGCRCRLTGSQLARLRAALEQGPAAWGWTEDQRWTLPRVTTLIGRLCHVRYTPRGTSYLLNWMGFTPQGPVHRAIEREADYAGLITAAHRQLPAPVILIWDNLNTHSSAVMRTFTGAHPDWLSGFLAQTGLTLEPEPP